VARGVRPLRTSSRLGEFVTITRRDAALRLDIPLEMATRHGIPPRMTESDLAEIEANPPAWLLQSRTNRTGKPVWVQLTCDVCGYSEPARPKKWWPQFSYLTCDFHRADELTQPAPGLYRREIDGIGTRFIGVVDEKP
jgi:hypothetical protein